MFIIFKKKKKKKKKKKNNFYFFKKKKKKKKKKKRYKLLAECVGHTEAISAVALSRKRNQFILTGSQDRTIKCWDITKLSM